MREGVGGSIPRAGALRDEREVHFADEGDPIEHLPRGPHMIQGKAMPSVSAIASTEPTRMAIMSPAVRSLFPRAPMKDVWESTKRFIPAAYQK